MKPLTNFFFFQAKRRFLLLTLLLVLPLTIPYILFGIVSIFQSADIQPKIIPTKLENLPQPTSFPDFSDNLTYFSYSPNDELTTKLIKNLIEVNGLKNAKIRPFESLEEANSYFATKNLKNQPKNLTLSREIFCADYQKYFEIDSCSASFIDNFDQNLPNFYNFSTSDNDEIFLHIHLQREGQILDFPQNLTVHLTTNTTMLDRLIATKPDKISKFLNTETPFWTSYGVTLQAQIDEFIVKTFTNTTVKYAFSHLQPIQIGGQLIPISMFFGMAVLVAFSLQLVLAVLWANINREANHVVLRRLGVRESQFFTLNLIFIAFPIVFSNFLNIFIWHFSGVVPFSSIDSWFCAVLACFMSFCVISTAVLISVIFGNKRSASTLISCVLSFAFLLLPMTFSAFLRTIFDPSLISQNVVFIIVVFCPVFALYALLDGIFFNLGDFTGNILNYQWKVAAELIPVELIFEDLNGYSTIVRECSISESLHGVINEFGKCTFQVPMYYSLLVTVFVQFLVCVLLAFIVAHVKPEKGHRGLHFWFFLLPSFYKKLVVDLNLGCQVENIKVKYYFPHKVVFRNLSLDMTPNKTSALVGEAGQGKSTILSILAGEKRFSSGIVSVLGVDLENDVNAYKIKPYIGYCPQDFSNVWLGMTVMENIRFSLKIRCQMNGEDFSAQENYLSQLLTQCGLGDVKVQNRKAKKLSGGMLRRLAFCNAIVGSKLLLLDEITAGVDPVLKRSIWNIIQNLNKTILITSHDMSEIQEMAQNITIINNGKEIINNMDQFELKNINQKFEFTLYKSQVIEDLDLLQLREALHIEIELVTRQQHIIKVSSLKSLSLIEVINISDSLDSFIKRNRFDDYNINKSSLSQYYIELINLSNKEVKHDSIKQLKTYKCSQNNALLLKSIHHDFRLQKIPTLFILIFISLILTILTYIFYYLFMNAFNKLPDFNLITRTKMAKHCFDSCINENFEGNHHDRLHQCLTKRSPQKLFQTSGNFPQQPSSCQYYFAWLGLDQKNGFDHQFGDNAKFFDSPQYSFQISSKSKIGVVPRKENFTTYENLYQTNPDIYDPLTKQQDNILPYIKGLTFNIQNEICGEMNYCQTLCFELQNQFYQCQEVFPINHCVNSCFEEYNCIDVPLKVLSQDVYQISSLDEGLQNYRNLAFLNDKIINLNQTQYNLHKGFSELNKNAPYAIIDILKETEKEISANVAMLMPFTGHSQQYYSYNYMRFYFNETPVYKCGSYNFEYNHRSHIAQASLDGARKSQDLYNSITQSQPDRSHVQLINLGSQPLIQFTSAILRRHLFKNATDYSPWEFQYSYHVSEMPVFADPTILNSTTQVNDMLVSVSSLEFIVAGMFPLALTAIQVGREYDVGAGVLYQIHGISPSRWAIISIFYYSVIGTIIIAANLVLAYFICPFIIIDQIRTIFFYVLQSYTGVVSGFLIAIIAKKSKPSSMIAFFIIILSLVFQFMFLNTRYFSLVISFFIPCYGFVYQQSLSVWGEQGDFIIMITSLVLFLVHFFAVFVILNFQRLKFRLFRKHIQSDTPLLFDKENALTVLQISHTYDGTNYALKGLSFGVQKNEVFGLLGANGSGKSTLLHCLTGIYNPTSGVAYVGKIPLFEQKQTSNFISIVPQQDILFPSLTVLDHLIFAAKSARISPNLTEITVRMQLQHLLNIPIVKLSTGEKRKISIALSLCAGTQIIALDEPSCGLGAVTKNIVQNAINELIQCGKTVILTTHDMEEVENCVERCLILKNGEVCASGDISELRRASGVLIVNMKITEGQCQELQELLSQKGVQYQVIYNKFQDLFTFKFSNLVKIQTILLCINEGDLQDIGWSVENVKMEQVFMDVVGE